MKNIAIVLKMINVQRSAIVDNIMNMDAVTNIIMKKNIISFSTASCKGTDWIYNGSGQWTLTTSSAVLYHVFGVSSTGFVVIDGVAVASSVGVRPVLYLKSDVSITGTGTTSDGINYYIVE